MRCLLVDAVCVLEAQVFEMLLKASTSEDVEFEFSGGQLHIRTCSDTCVALRNILLCLAAESSSTVSEQGSVTEGRDGHEEELKEATPLISPTAEQEVEEEFKVGPKDCPPPPPDDDDALYFLPFFLVLGSSAF